MELKPKDKVTLTIGSQATVIKELGLKTSIHQIRSNLLTWQDRKWH